MDQRRQIGARLTPGGQGAQIARQPPARIEGRAQHRHGLAAQQRLEPQGRGDCPNLVHGLDQRDWVGIGGDMIGQGCQRCGIDHAGA